MDQSKSKKRVALCVAGGIAAYKAIEICRVLQKAGCDVRVAMTTHATEFVNPMTFRAFTNRPVIVNDYDRDNPDPIAHINFSQEIDLFLVAPATANIIGKFANGIADDFISTTYLASTAPVLIAPAMNTTMWDHPAMQRNIRMLEADGVSFVSPVSGELACKKVGIGKLENVENIAAQALEMLSEEFEKDLAGEKFLITVGGTREAIDPVRFISNSSSGKMGFAIAERAARRGAEVTVVVGSTSVTPPTGVSVVSAQSAAEMFAAVKTRIAKSSVFIGAAAVADYRPINSADAKIKKEEKDTLKLELEKTEDILANVSNSRHKGLLVVGFAAETNNVIEHAREKMTRKNLDIVVANDITKAGAGFDADTNIATIIVRKTGQEIDLPIMQKRVLADQILDEILKLRR